MTGLVHLSESVESRAGAGADAQRPQPTALDLIKGQVTERIPVGAILATRKVKTIRVRDFGQGRAEIVVMDSVGIDNGPFRRDRFTVWDNSTREISDSPELRKERNLKRSARRARQVVRWRAMSIGVDRLLTLTYRENMQDLQQARADFDKFRRRMQKDGYLQHFVAVPERQERGAWHIHIAIKGWLPVAEVRAHWLAVIGDGNIDIARSSHRRTDAKTIAAYLAKYIGKTFEAVDDQRARYWASRGYAEPVKTLHVVDGEDWITSLRIAYALALELGATSIDFAFSEAAGFFWMSTA